MEDWNMTFCCIVQKENKKVRLWALGNSVLRTLKPAWVDGKTLSLFPGRELFVFSRSCLHGLRVFAVNCIVEIRVE